MPFKEKKADVKFQKFFLSPGKFRKRKRILEMTEMKKEQDDHDPNHVLMFTIYIYSKSEGCF